MKTLFVFRKCGNALELDCKLRDKCYRFIASNSPDQKFANFDYYANSCNGYWEVLSAQEEATETYIQNKEEFKLY